MDDIKAFNKRLEVLAWAAALVLVGVLSIIPGDQSDLALIGIGIVLLAMNLARSLGRIPANPVTISLGIMAILVGALSIVLRALGVHAHVGFFPVALLAGGIACVVYALTRVRSHTTEN